MSGVARLSGVRGQRRCEVSSVWTAVGSAAACMLPMLAPMIAASASHFASTPMLIDSREFDVRTFAFRSSFARWGWVSVLSSHTNSKSFANFQKGRISGAASARRQRILHFFLRITVALLSRVLHLFSDMTDGSVFRSLSKAVRQHGALHCRWEHRACSFLRQFSQLSITDILLDRVLHCTDTPFVSVSLSFSGHASAALMQC